MATITTSTACLGDTACPWNESLEFGFACALITGQDVTVSEGPRRATCTPAAARLARTAKDDAVRAWTTWYESEPQWYRDWCKTTGKAYPREPSTYIDFGAFVSP